MKNYLIMSALQKKMTEVNSSVLNNIASGTDINFFPSAYVFRCPVKNHESIKKELLPVLLEEYEWNKNNDDYAWSLDNPSGIVTNYKSCDRKYYSKKHYDEIVWNSMDALIDFLYVKNQVYCPLPISPKNSVLQNIWWNVYDPDAYAIVHNHGYGDISGIYILELNEPNTTTFIANDVHPYGRANLYDRTTKELTYAKEGDVLLFPSSLLHYVHPAKKRRVTVAFNISSEFS